METDDLHLGLTGRRDAKPETALTTPTRKNSTPVRVYCLPEERAELKALASAANKSVSNYLLNVGLGYQLSGVVDHRQVEELARINGDLGRLGGLLKLWLTNDERTAEFGESTIGALLAKIEATQDAMHAVIRTVIQPRKAQR